MNLLWTMIADTVSDAQQQQRRRERAAPIGRAIAELLGLAPLDQVARNSNTGGRNLPTASTCAKCDASSSHTSCAPVRAASTSGRRR